MMICQRCLRRLSARPTPTSHLFPPTRKPSTRFSTSSSSFNSSPPAAPSQPTSTLPPKPTDSRPPRAPPKSAAKLPASSVPAGTVLKGLNFLKNKQDPVAREDAEYPAWLWTVLDKRRGGAGKDGEAGGAGGAEGDLFAKSKKQRQIAAKALRKQALLNPGALAPRIPIYEQSVDLPSGQGGGGASGGLEESLEAVRARKELTRAMRQKRKAAIKEDNFLRSMR